MEKYKTISFCGQAAQGKDVLANYLVEKFNSEITNREDYWVRNAFANAVKEVFEQTFQVDREFVEHWKRNPKPPEGFLQSIRDCLIGIGDGFRKMKPDIWINLAFINQKNNQIISDCRYISEAEYVKNTGGYNILLWRPGHENNIQNDSEQQLMPYVKQLSKLNFEGFIPEDYDIPFDFFIINDGNIEKLYEKADKLIIPKLKKTKFI